MDLKKIRADADVFLSVLPYSDLTQEDAVTGIIALYRHLGLIDYAVEKSILGEVEEEERAVREAAEKRRQERAKLNPELVKREEALYEISRIGLQAMERNILTSWLGYNPFAAQKQEQDAIRQWWRNNGMDV